MFHELLFALHGFTGNIFVLEGGRICVLKDLSFLHPGEVEVLNRLCLLGTSYRYFQDFISSPTDGSQGLYLQAYCTGLNKVMNSYTQCLVELEKEVMTDQHISLSHFQHQLDKYHLVFPALEQLTEHIKKQKVYGCRILDAVYKYTSSGIPLVKEAASKILKSCHHILYKQLTAWMLHGILLDPFKEFFIQKRETVESENSKELSVSNDRRSLDVYFLNPDVLPSYILSRVAEKILFAGHSVCCFGKNQISSTTYLGVTTCGQEDYFAQQLFALQDKSFCSLEFEKVIDQIRTSASEHVWKVIVEQGNLVAHLRTVKDFYLIGRGELFQAFIDHANHLLRVPPGPATEHEVNIAFQSSAHQLFMDGDQVTRKIYVTLKSGESKPEKVEEVETGWCRIGLSYEVPWPLHVLLTPTILERYSVIFRFLLAIRRAQLELHQCWAIQMLNKDVGRDSVNTPLWQLRTHMAFLIDNLQYYLQVDVLESNFTQLEEKVKTVQDFEAIQLAHENFLSSVFSQSFLLLKPVYQCLMEIVELCLSLCVLVTNSHGQMSSQEFLRLNDITLNFKRHTSLLFRILSSVRSHQASPHLAQLLLRIDYNKYFTRCGGQLGGNISTQATSQAH